MVTQTQPQRPVADCPCCGAVLCTIAAIFFFALVTWLAHGAGYSSGYGRGYDGGYTDAQKIERNKCHAGEN